MKIVTERETLREVPSRWRRTYSRQIDGTSLDIPWKGRRTKRAIADDLAALNPETCTSEQIDAIIGNTSWTTVVCDECERRDVREYVSIGGNDEYGPDFLCFDCIRKAAELVKEYDR